MQNQTAVLCDDNKPTKTQLSDTQMQLTNADVYGIPQYTIGICTGNSAELLNLESPLSVPYATKSTAETKHPKKARHQASNQLETHISSTAGCAI